MIESEEDMLDELELLTVPEAAKIMKLPVSTVYMLCQREDLPAFKVGKAVRLRRIDLARWMQERVSQPKSE